MEARVNKRVKRSQRDYGMAFKLAVITQVEKGELTYKEAQRRFGIQGKSTVLNWLRKHGSLDWSRPEVHGMSSKERETPQQQIRRLERELSDERLKNEILNEMVDVMDRDYGAGLRKKYLEGRSVGNNETKE
jgi:transposase-like protein